MPGPLTKHTLNKSAKRAMLVSFAAMLVGAGLPLRIGNHHGEKGFVKYQGHLIDDFNDPALLILVAATIAFVISSCLAYTTQTNHRTNRQSDDSGGSASANSNTLYIPPGQASSGQKLPNTARNAFWSQIIEYCQSQRVNHQLKPPQVISLLVYIDQVRQQRTASDRKNDGQLTTSLLVDGTGTAVTDTLEKFLDPIPVELIPATNTRQPVDNPNGAYLIVEGPVKDSNYSVTNPEYNSYACHYIVMSPNEKDGGFYIIHHGAQEIADFNQLSCMTSDNIDIKNAAIAPYVTRVHGQSFRRLKVNTQAQTSVDESRSVDSDEGENSSVFSATDDLENQHLTSSRYNTFASAAACAASAVRGVSASARLEEGNPTDGNIVSGIFV